MERNYCYSHMHIAYAHFVDSFCNLVFLAVH